MKNSVSLVILIILLVVRPFSHSANLTSSDVISILDNQVKIVSNSTDLRVAGKVFFVSIGTRYKYGSDTVFMWVNISSESEIVECRLNYSYEIRNISKGPFSVPIELNSSDFMYGKYISVWVANITITELKNLSDTLKVNMTLIFRDTDGELHSYSFTKNFEPLSETKTGKSQPLAWTTILMFITSIPIAIFAFVRVYFKRKNHESSLNQSL